METRWSSDVEEMDESRLSSRDAILLKCRETIEALTADLEQERTSCLSAESEIRTLHRELASLEETVESLRRHEQAASDSMRTLTEEKTTAAQRIQRLEQETSALREDRAETQAQCQSLQSKLKTTSEALERANRELSSKQQLMTQWTHALPALETRLEDLTRENQRLAADRDRWQALYDQEKERGRRLQVTAEDLKQENETLGRKAQSTAAEWQKRLEAVERLGNLKQQELTETFNRKAAAYHDQFQQGLKEQKALIEKATDEVTRLQRENEELEAQLQSTQDLLAAKEAEVDSLQQEREELKGVVEDLQALKKANKEETEIKEKMYSAVLGQLDEANQQVSKLESQLEEVTRETAHRESFYQSQIADMRQQVDKAKEDLRASQDLLRASEKLAEDSLRRLQSEHLAEVKRAREEAELLRERSVSTLESRVGEVESQRESDHDYFQIELLRAKEEYTRALIDKEEELQKVRAERDRLRGDLEPTRMPKATPRSFNPAATSRPAATSTMKSVRKYSSQSLRQSLDSPSSSLSRLSKPDDLRLYASPRSTEPLSQSHSDGLRLLSQLKELTTRMERTTPDESAPQHAVIIAVESDQDSSDGSPQSPVSIEAPADPLPPTKAPHQRCYDCGQHAAARICICQFPLKSYCPACAHVHLKRKGPKMHLLVPIHAAELLTSEESVPDFITREVFSNNVTEALINNLTRVASAKEELKSVCSKLHNEIDAYRDGRLQELCDVETQLKQRIDLALKGIEDIRYLPSFQPKNEPERLILEEWRNSVENMTERLSMFVSTATVEHIALQLPTIAHFHVNYGVLYPPTSHQPRTFLPCIQSNGLKSLLLTTHTWRDIPLTLHTDITYTSAVSFLDNGDLFACGGKAHNKAYIIDGLTLDIREIAPMNIPRYLHGLVATPDDVYVFGGKNDSDLRDCEKYSLRSKAWADIRPMHRPRSTITPCRYYMKIYIAGGHTNTFETYSLVTDKFELHLLGSVMLNGATCVAGDRCILILAKPGVIELDSTGRFAGKRGALEGNEWWSTVSPVSFNSEVYFCRKVASGVPSVYKLVLATRKVELVA